jgi:hypothetical protein
VEGHDGEGLLAISLLFIPTRWLLAANHGRSNDVDMESFLEVVHLRPARHGKIIRHVRLRAYFLTTALSMDATRHHRTTCVPQRNAQSTLVHSTAAARGCTCACTERRNSTWVQNELVAAVLADVVITV